jgi:hypothetical protein
VILAGNGLETGRREAPRFRFGRTPHRAKPLARAEKHRMIV